MFSLTKASVFLAQVGRCVYNSEYDSEPYFLFSLISDIIFTKSESSLPISPSKYPSEQEGKCSSFLLHQFYLLKRLIELDTSFNDDLFCFDIQQLETFKFIRISNKQTLYALRFQIPPFIKWNSSPCSGPKHPQIRHIRLVSEVCLERSLYFHG